MDPTGKVAVITGGASGIGLATARQLAPVAAAIVLVDIEEGALAAAAQTLREPSARRDVPQSAQEQLSQLPGRTAEFAPSKRHPARVETRVCDVTDYAAMTRLAEDVVATCGGAHIVFNNAGIAVGGPVAEMSHDDWRWVIDVDLWGPIHGVEAFLPHLRASGEPGHLLFTASFAGLVPNVGLGPYCVAKYGVVALAEVLHKELRDDRIGVSVLCPMRVGTNIGRSERNRQRRYGDADPAAGVADQGEANEDLAGRVLDVDDVAAQVVEAIRHDRLYILPHEESRPFIRRRFERIDRAFDH